MIGYAISLIAVMIAASALCTNSPFEPDMEEYTMRWYLHLIPAFPSNRVNLYLANSCGFDKCIESWDRLPTDIVLAIKTSYMNAAIYLILAIYLSEVVPQDYGIPKHPLFCLKRPLLAISRSLTNKVFGADDISETSSSDFEIAKYEDQDSKNERNFIYGLKKKDYSSYPLIVKDIKKVYPGLHGRPPKVANHSISLSINSGELFGLLGPNGAGKTTLISQLTGLYAPTKGNAWIGGCSLQDELQLVQLQIGLCPQFDVLWDDLTVEEHLLFYARVKGIAPNEEVEYVKKAIADVHLTKHTQTQTKELPLGMRRRLSIAIALVSKPKVVFLDEPTTGLDPETRR